MIQMGRCVLQSFRNLIGDRALTMDITDATDLDGLHYPTGVIADSQKMVAEIFGADRCFYLINGTTAGIHASVLATCPPGTICLMARNCHQSAYNAVLLAGCTPKYLKPEIDAKHGIAHGVHPADVKIKLTNAKSRGIQVGAVFVTSPTYFGAVSDVQGIAETCHAFEVPLIVDDAHGAHFTFHGAFPSDPLSCGADVVIQSTHKVLTSLTQSSMLHLRSSLVSAEKISKWLAVLQSSSPNYMMMASLEAAACHASDCSVFDEPLRAAQVAVDGLKKIRGLSLISEASQLKTVLDFDPLRVCVNVSAWGVSTATVAEKLDVEFNVVCEMTTDQIVVFAFGPGSVVDDARALLQAMQQLAERWMPCSLSRPRDGLISFEIPPIQLTPSEASVRKTQRVLLEESVDMTCGEMVTTYPPGIPHIVPGEVITPSFLQQIKILLAQGANITGPSDLSLKTILVIA